ncbi:hypothetical protein, partial [Natronorubrum sp. DTA7]|uniref:hypothetical protein n=1 Tax=Natronorubrum sp. DTA7 TaxID=3447016 RepID=UPI003F854BBA
MGANSTYENPAVQYDSASWLISAVGALLGISGVAYIVTHPEPAIVWVTELALVSIPSAAIVYGGYWIAANHVPQEDGWDIAKWCVLGAVVAALPLFGYIRAEQIGGEAVINPELLVILGALGGGVVALFAAISNERYHLDIATSTHDDVQLISVDSEPFSTEAQTLA